MERTPYKVPLDYRYIKAIRMARNKTIKQFSEYMEVDPTTISRLENQKLNFTVFYESKLRNAISKLRITNSELLAIKQVIDFQHRGR